MSNIREGMPYEDLLNEARIWESRAHRRRAADASNYQTSKDAHIGAALEEMNLRLDKIEKQLSDLALDKAIADIPKDAVIDRKPRYLLVEPEYYEAAVRVMTTQYEE